MDFKSTIFIFGIALIFILPLVISSPISGEGIYQKKRVIDLEEAFGEEAKERVKRGGKQPGSKGYVKQNGTHRDKFKGGDANQWHVHDEGSNPHIKLGSTQFNLDKNNPRQNKREARKALQHLDALQSKPKEPQLSRLRNAILSIIRNGHT